jgi:hypothetical protein
MRSSSLASSAYASTKRIGSASQRLVSAAMPSAEMVSGLAAGPMIHMCVCWRQTIRWTGIDYATGTSGVIKRAQLPPLLAVPLRSEYEPEAPLRRSLPPAV